jgi:serine-type D-Ala-D-Ala carboxypeptidase/endopeptidase (penicillin-binding protein 4)
MVRARLAVPAAAAVVACALVAASVSAPAGADDDPAVVLQPVSEQSGPPQDASKMAERVAKLATSTDMGKAAGTIIMDAETGTVLYDDEAQTSHIPASTNKLATAVGALRLIGANTRIATKVTKAPDSSDVYIVGGGDPLLVSRKTKAQPGVPNYPASTPLPKLARQTAEALKAASVGSIDLKVDDSLFSGPDWGPDWPEYFRTSGIVSPVTALLVNDGRVGGPFGAKVADPGMAGGQTFADLLRKDGITVSSVKREHSPQQAEEIASIQSVPVYEIVGQALTTSDNDTAEDLFRLAGVAGGFGGSFEGGGKAVDKALGDIGVSTVMASFHDGSGLSKLDSIPPKLLADILSKVVKGEDGLWPIGSGLSVAGVGGTLRYRFTAVDTDAGAGWVRAKTGTLTSVSALAGFVQSVSGRMLVFASLSNDAPSSADAAHVIDQIVVAAASCGCPGSDR